MEIKWFKKLNFKAIIDVGANEGQSIEKFSKIFPEAVFYCFEPLPEPFQKLKNKFQNQNNVHLYPLALGNESSEKIIFRNEFSPSSSILPMKKIHKTAFTYTEKEFKEKIEIRRLDDILKNTLIAKPYFVKIDVQGFEAEVIKGGMETIKNANVIILETSFIQLYEGAPLFDDIYVILRDAGFEYIGAYDQLANPNDGMILQQDAIFIKKQ